MPNSSESLAHGWAEPSAQQIPHQPLLFAPSELRACGLRDAHTRPFVGRRTGDGVKSWRTSPALAWQWPLVEWSRTGNSYAALGFDCDSREAVERAAASCMGGGDLPTPNVMATRAASGHAQVFYLLDRPVHRGAHARTKPLRHLGRVAEFYRATLGADAGYTGVLSSNPIHDDYQTSYPRAEPYALADLAEAIPKGWRVPQVPTTGEGKNCSLFAALCKLGLGCSDDGLLTWARKLNSEFDPHLPDGEVRGVWRSVCRYRARWRGQGHQQAWLWRQAARGKRGGVASGVARKSKLARRNSQWAVMHHNGSTYRDIARAEGVNPGTVYRGVARSQYR